MSILSFAYLLFVAAAVVVHRRVPARARPFVLLGASLAFYATHGPFYALPLLFVATVLAQQAALAVERADAEAKKLRLAAFAVAALVLALAGLKVATALWPPVTEHVPGVHGRALEVLVPLGLSYYSFKLVAYVLEVYWGNLPAERSLATLGLYAAFFPQIVSGPIQRPGEFFADVTRRDAFDPELMSAGLRRILFGLFKKLAIADRLAPLVDGVHKNPGAFSSLELLLAAYLFALELYADFSGVTDIALGIGYLFGVRGPENFELPFFARNLQEYWRRWHMSLTSWLADYLFTPLRMALRDYGQPGLVLAILVNMVAVGVWHGASWTYAAFGLLHGIMLAVSVVTLKRRDAFFRRHPGLARVRSVTAPLVTFHLVVLGLVIFRADSVAHAGTYLSELVGGFGRSPVAHARLDFKLLGLSPKAMLSLVLLGAAMEAVHAARRRPELVRRFTTVPRLYRWAIYYGVIVLTLVMSRLGEEKFIYAQF